MRVSRLEIFGFKSFMERLVLPLEGGITGVVGPNGCGKSNIVDALRWVLGETRASNLRGGVLEDVIFNGTDKLRPLGLAEVTITLRATSQDFFSDLISPAREADLIASLDLPPAPKEEEIEVTDAADEQARPRLTVIEGRLGADESAHAETESEVAESETQEVMAAEENEEPALGAENQETKSREEEAPAEATMLTRFAWLKAVSEVQVTRRLYRSGESEFFINRVPCRLKDLKDFFRAVGIGARAYTIVAQGEVTRIISAKPEDRRLILEEAAGVLGFRDKIAAANRRLEDTSVNVSRIEDVIKEVTRQVNSLRVQASRAKNRQSLKEQIHAFDKLLLRDSYVECLEHQKSGELALGEFKAKESELDAELQKVTSEEQEARGDLMRIDVEADGFRSKIDALRDELERRAQQRGRYSSRVNELRAFGLAKNTEIKRLEEQQNTLANREAESKTEVEQLLLKEKDLLEVLSGLGQDSTDELREISRRRDELRGKLREKENALREIRDRMISTQSSIKALEEQIVAASPLNQLKQTTDSQDMEALRSVASDATLFAEGISVPAKYAKAVQGFLAERAKFIVSQEPEKIARYFVDRASRKEGKGAGIGIFRAGEAASNLAALPENVSLPAMLPLLTINAGCKLAASRVFADVFVADSINEAFAFFEGAAASGLDLKEAKVVTLEGEIITAFSFYSLRHEGGLIQLKRRVEDLKESCGTFESEHARLGAERDTLQGEIRAAEERHAQVLKESQERQAKARDLNNQLGNVRGRLQAAQRLAQQMLQDLARAKRLFEEAHLKIKEYHDEEAKVQEEMRALVPEADAQVIDELNAVKLEYDKVEQVRRAGRNVLSDLAGKVHSARNALDKVRSESSKYLLEVQKAELEKQNLVQRVINEYGEEMLALVTSSEETLRLDPQIRSESQAEVQKLRARIIREGDVDPSSIERFDEENARLENLEKQKADLETAAQTLTRTISRLTETSEKRFLETFNAVRENFSRLVPRLFGGGKASLDLIDPSHPLESGVEIMTRPPGKKPKSIELLSGGEKALCATALIFAMFLERPSPLCVLDEVDAPLDEANLVRFLTLVKEMSTKTQFLLITHNKNSMAVADNLVGVTQEEPGASKLIAVSLQEAFSQVA